MTKASKPYSSDSHQTATQFSGLVSYPNALSDVPAGSLQLASNVVIDRPGIVSPRRGQRRYSEYVTNLLTANQATGGDTLTALTGFFAGNVAAYNSPASDTTLTLNGPDTTRAWQGLYSVSVTYSVMTPAGGLCLLSTLPTTTGVYTFSVWVAFVGASSFNALLSVRDASGALLFSSSTPVIGSSFKWQRLTGTFTATGNSAIQIAVTQDGAADNQVFVDGLQLQAGAVASVWTPPGGLVCTRLFQVNESVYGFFTADGLPTSPGSFFRVVDTVAGAPQPAAAKAVWSATPNYFYPPPANAVHELQSKNVQYYSTADGIMKLLADLSGTGSGSIVPAGMPFGLDTQVTLNAAPAGSLGFLQGGYATAYRVVWGNTDPQGNLTLGAPSPAVTIANPTLTKGQALNNVNITTVSPTAGLYPATMVYVTLPWTATGTFSYPVQVVQGGLISKGTLTTSLSGGNIGTVWLNDVVHYFGPIGTPVSVVLQGACTAFAAGPPATLTFGAGFVQSTQWAGIGLTAYQPFNSATPGTTAGASAQSAILTAPTSTTITVTTGSAFTPGPVGIVVPCTIQQQQTTRVYLQHNTGLYTDPAVGDNLTFPGITAPSVVTAVTNNIDITGAGSVVDVVTLTAFPEGLILSASQTVAIARPANTSVSFVVPQEAYLYTAASTGQNTTAFYQVYRSYTQAQIIAGQPTQPTDVMQQCYQGALTGTSGATLISFTDIAPDATLGAEIYTSPQQPNGGILGALFQPPVASDMTLYQGSALYANCFLPATFSTQLLAVASTNSGLAALQPGDAVIVNGVTFTAQYAGSPAGPNPFAISAGSGSVTTDTTTTVNNLARQVNSYYVAPTDTVFGNPIVGENVTLLGTSTPLDLGGNMSWRTARGVGKFTLEFVSYSGSPHASPFVDLPANTVVTVLPTEQQNAVFYSPQDEPEGVPLLNSIVVGAANYPVQRVVPLPGSCLIFKPEGVFQLAGTTTAQFSVQALNSKAQLLSNESAVVLQGSVIAFTTQGVTTITPSGVQILSLAINDELLALSQLPAFASTAFGVAHETERRFMLWAPSVSTDTLPTQAYTYNLITNAWTKWPLPRVCGLVSLSDQLLYSGSMAGSAVTGQPGVFREASGVGDAQYGDELVTGTFTVTGSRSGTLSGLTAPAGMNIPVNFGSGTALVLQSAVVYPTGITSIDGTSVALTFGADLTAPSGAATLVQPTVCQFAPVPIVCDAEGTVKQFQEFSFNFVSTTCPNITALASTDFGFSNRVLPLTPPGQPAYPGVGWGSQQWGHFQWGGNAAVSAIAPISARQLVPIDAARGHSFWPAVTANVAANYFGAQALTINWVLTRSTRQR